VHDETVAIHGAYTSDWTRAVAVPVYQTIAHDFEDAAHAGAVFDLDIPGFHYNRLNNPTNSVLEGRLQAIEGGAGAVVLSSGAAAVNYSITNLASAGDNIVTTPQLYGSTYTLFAYVFPGQGIEVRFAEDDRPASIEPLIDASTKAIFCESVGNPALNVVDLRAVSDLAHGHGVPLIVDNTIATPMYLKPISHGADVVVESLTKFIGGHGTTLGGAIIDAGRFPWAEHADRFPMFNRPEPAFHGVVYAEQFSEAPYAVRCRTVSLRNTGSTLSPFGAFLLLQGLETLAVRLERHESNTRAIARYLADDPRVEWLSWLGDPRFPYYDLAQHYLNGHCPSIITFGVAGGYEAGIRFFDSLKLFKRLVNMGDAKSLVAHPASTTHRQLSPEALALVGVAPETIRLSIGIEHVDDLIADIDQALSAARRA
jgi:O-acetylhomoserine (thiol)-lyase